MAKGKKRRKKVARRGRRGGRPIHLGRIIVHPITRRAAVAATVLVAILLYSHQAWRDVSSSQEFRLRRISVDLVEGSGPLEDPMRSDLEQLLGRVKERSLFDTGLVARLARGIRSLPWVEDLVEVERAYPDRLRVLMRIRRPVAAVSLPGGERVLVDAAGAPLPGKYYVMGQPGEVLLLEGLGRARRSSGAVGEGVRIVSELESAGVTEVCALRGVDLSNLGGRERPGESEIILRTAAGADIEWGRPSGDRRALDEPSVKMKMEGLREVLRRYPGLEGVLRVRLQFPEPTVELEPVAQAQ